MDRQAASSEHNPSRMEGFRCLPTGPGTLIALVTCAGLVVWVARFVWERERPDIVALRELRAPIPSKRVHALRELGQFGHRDPGALIPPMIVALRDKNAEVRMAAADALMYVSSDALKLGSADRAVSDVAVALLEALADSEPRVRLTAVRALAFLVAHSKADAIVDPRAIQDALVPALHDADSEVRLAVIEALGTTARRGGAEPPQELVSTLADTSADHRAAAVNALACFPRALDPWIPMLFRFLSDENASVRAAAARALDRLNPPAASAAAIPALVEALASRDSQQRLHAAKALAPLARDPGASAAIPALLAVVRGTNAANARAITTNARPSVDRPSEEFHTEGLVTSLLGQIAPGTLFADDAISVLTEIVRSGKQFQPERAALALGDFGPARSRPSPR